MVQTFGWACKCNDCRQHGTNNCRNKDVLYIGYAKDPGARCVDRYDGTAHDGITAHGVFCAHALMARQQHASQNNERDITCECLNVMIAWLPIKLGKMCGEDLTPGSPWSEGDVAPVPLSQAELIAECTNIWNIHCRPDWKNKQEFPGKPHFPERKKMCSKPLQEWVLRPAKEVKVEDPNPAPRMVLREQFRNRVLQRRCRSFLAEVL